jgi:hypothetical protein
VGTFFHHALGCGQANPAVAASYDRNLTLKLSHDFSFRHVGQHLYSQLRKYAV